LPAPDYVNGFRSVKEYWEEVISEMIVKKLEIKIVTHWAVRSPNLTLRE